MIFITGDIHGSPWGVLKFARKQKVTKNDIIIIPGDVGANYYGTDWDEEMKANLSHHRATVLCVHGNHEMRPWEVEGYHLIDWMGGKAWVQDAFPTLIFAKDGEIYNIEGLRIMTIGGAYSVDKIWRILKGSGWWESEQPTEEIKAFVEKQLSENEVDIIISHTCPLKYEPVEVFLPGIDQSKVDKSTEEWLGKIEATYPYKAWYCGHFHIDKHIDKIHFMYRTWETIEKEHLINEN